MVKILLGVDGSEFAEKAFKQAIEITKKFAADMKIQRRKS